MEGENILKPGGMGLNFPGSSEKQNDPSSESRSPGRGGMDKINSARRGASSLGKDMAKNLTKQGAKKAATSFASFVASNPLALALIVAVIAILITFFLIISAIKYSCQHFPDDPVRFGPVAFIGNLAGICSLPDVPRVDAPLPPSGVTFIVTGPEGNIKNTGLLNYEVTARYDPSADNAISFEEFKKLSIFDVPLFDYGIASISGKYETGLGSDGRSYIQWQFSKQDNPDSYNHSFILVLNPSESDFIATNTFYTSKDYVELNVTYPTEVGPSTTSSGQSPKECGSRAENDIWYGADCLPTKNYCQNNKYKPRIDETMAWLAKFPKENPVGDGGNFGDPLCSFTRAKANKIIDELESSQDRASFWKDIITCEGGVNSYGRQVHPTTGRPNGPAGMFQMNIGNPIFKKWSPSNTLRGDVPWQRQIQDAIANNNIDRKNNNDFGFYGSAMCLCWWPEYRTKDYCKDILRKGIGSTTGPRAPSTNCPTGSQYLSCNTAVKCTNVACNDIGMRGPR